MKGPIPISKTLNAFVLLLGLSLLSLTLLDKTKFGHGLGDIAYLFGLAATVSAHLYVTLRAQGKLNPKQRRLLLIAFLLIYGFFAYKMSLGRGPEFKWNGQFICSALQIEKPPS